MTDERVYIVGAFEHPTREAPDTSTPHLHAEVASGAIADAGLESADVDGYLTAGVREDVSTLPALAMTDFLGLDVTAFDTTDVGGGSYVSHVAHAADAIRQGRCSVALVTQAGRPRSRHQDTGTELRTLDAYQDSFELVYGTPILSLFALGARRHMYEYGTTSEQLAAIRVAAAHHAQHNPNAMYPDPVTVDDVVTSPIVADPLHRLDCCVITDGGGALVLAGESALPATDSVPVEMRGTGETITHHDAGRIDLTRTGAATSGAAAFAAAGCEPADIDYAGIYDATTFAVLATLEDLGFCEQGAGGSFVEDGALEAPDGDLPFNTDGGSLCSNHPGNRGGMPKLIEAVRQLRGDAHPAVQVPDATMALVHGLGGPFARRFQSATVVLGATSSG